MTIRIIATLVAMVVGHLFSPIVRAGEIRIVRPNSKSDTGGKMLTFNPNGTISIDAPTPPAVTITKDGTILATDKDGWTTTIRPGQVQPSESETEDFCGYQIPKGQPANCVGAYDRAQNDLVARSQAYNLAMARINAQRYRAQNNGGNRNRIYIRTR